MVLVKDDPASIPDEEGEKLAKEFFALFAIICDPKYFGEICLWGAIDPDAVEHDQRADRSASLDSDPPRGVRDGGTQINLNARRA